MLGYEMIKKGVIGMIKPLGINIIASDMRSGFKKPAFFVQLMPISEDSDCDISLNILTINIHYFSDDKTDLDNLKMLTKLRKIFVNCVEFEDRSLTIYDKRYELDENILQFKFDLKYTEGVEKEINPDLEKMEHLYIERS